MKEYYRKKGLKEIEEEAIDTESVRKELEITRKELEILKNDEKVNRYLKMIQDYEDLNRKRKKAINIMQKKLDGLYLSCTHDIWYYEGNHKTTFEDCVISRYRDIPTSNYKYICLECGLEIMRRDEEDFDKENIVLKNKEKETIQDKGYDYYRQLYFELLCKYNSEEAIKIIMNLFNRDLEEKSIQRSLRKEA